MEKQEIMKKAHKIAKQMKVRTRNYQIALSFALKLVWADTTKDWNMKEIAEYLNETRNEFNGVKVVETTQDLANAEIPAWLIKKNLTSAEQSAINYGAEKTIKRETEKAVLFQFTTDFGTIEMWAPKSVLVA